MTMISTTRMMNRRRSILWAVWWVLALAGCRQDDVVTPTAISVPPTAGTNPAPQPTASPTFPAEPAFITIAVSPPLEPFLHIDEFGDIQGLDADVMRRLAETTGLEIEFVSTNFDGLLNSVANGEFDATINRWLLPETAVEGIVFTQPYLEVGQQLIVRANDDRFASFADMQPGMRVGAPQNSFAMLAAEEVLGFAPNEVLQYETPTHALQAVIDGNLDGALVDSESGAYYAQTYFQQLKAVGEGREGWITTQRYGIGLAAGNAALIERLNEGIALLEESGELTAISSPYFTALDPLNAGDSLIGTAANEFVIGVVGELAGDLSDLNTSNQPPKSLNWEVAGNLNQGLYVLDQSNELTSHLFTDAFTSEDGLQYTFRLRGDLQFADGTPITAEEVRWSVMRSAGLGNWLVNSFLKDEDENGFADGDAIQALDPLSIRFDLQEPLSYFPTLLATPPYHILNKSCFESTESPWINCGGSAAYIVADWQPGERLQLRANPNYPGEPAQIANVQIRFYRSAMEMMDALNRGAIDLAWNGVGSAELATAAANDEYMVWQGAPAFSSSFVFVHDAAPWQNPLARRAIALAVDREALAQEPFAGIRQPLFQPIPDKTPGHSAQSQPRDIEQARALLRQVGYSESNPLTFTLWYVNDGRYSDVEGAYAAAIKSQLEETGMIEVAIQGEAWDVFRNQKSACAYEAFLQGWPTLGEPLPYSDGMSWLYYFVERPQTVCSNYDNQAMLAAFDALEALSWRDDAGRQAAYEEIQALWAAELPSLPLTQLPRYAISGSAVTQAQTNLLGLLRYDWLDKTAATP